MIRIFNRRSARALTSVLMGSFLYCSLAGNGCAQFSTKAENQLESEGFGAAQVSRFKVRAGASQYSVSNIQNRLSRQSVSAAGVRGVNQRNFLSATTNTLSRPSKPFSGVKQGPTISPFLALSSPRASASDYQTLIRPQQRARRENDREQAYALQRRRSLNQMAARAPFSTTGDDQRAPTGHAAVFQSLGSYQNTGNYFPPPSQPKQR